MQGLFLLLPFKETALVDVVSADAACHHPCLQGTAQLVGFGFIETQAWTSYNVESEEDIPAGPQHAAWQRRMVLGNDRRLAAVQATQDKE